MYGTKSRESGECAKNNIRVDRLKRNGEKEVNGGGEEST